MSHAVSDGQGFIEFLVAWAERAQGRDHPMGPPTFDRALLPTPPEMDRDAMTEMLKNEGFESVDPTLMLGRALVAGSVLVPDFLRFPPGNRMMVPVSKADVEKIRNAAGEGASQNEALSAHVWLELARLLGPEGLGFCEKARCWSTSPWSPRAAGREVCRTCISATPASACARGASKSATKTCAR